MHGQSGIKLFLKYINILDRKFLMPKIWLIFLGGNSVLYWDTYMGFEFEMFLDVYLDFFNMILLEQKFKYKLFTLIYLINLYLYGL